MRSKSAPDEKVRALCVAALARGLRLARSDIAIDGQGYVEKPEDNLVPGVQLSDFEADLSAGAGAELRGKFLAAHSSSALAVNCFAPLGRDEYPFDLGRHKGLRVPRFEQTFPTGLARAQPPHLDVVAREATGLVAIESKCTEYLSPKIPQFSERYTTEIQDERTDGPWYLEMLRLKAIGRVGYRSLDAAQLIKQALELSHQAKGEKRSLVYLYWVNRSTPVYHPYFFSTEARLPNSPSG